MLMESTSHFRSVSYLSDPGTGMQFAKLKRQTALKVHLQQFPYVPYRLIYNEILEMYLHYSHDNK